MEGVEPALQKKYHKITGISRGNSFSGSSGAGDTINFSQSPSSSSTTASTASSARPFIHREEYSFKPERFGVKEPARNVNVKDFPTLEQQAQQVLAMAKLQEKYKNATALPQQPLNLSTDSSSEVLRKRSLSNIGLSSTPPTSTQPSVPVTQPLQIETTMAATASHQNHHPQNPERSIIKSLLLNSRGLAVPTTGEGEDAVYTCPLCKISFRSADNLQYHTKCYCQGTPPVSTQSQPNSSPHSAPISPVGSPSHKYFRSNSFNLCLPEKYSPNTLAKLASSSLRHPHRTPLSLAKLAAQQTGGLYKPAAAALATSMALATTTSSARNRPENIVINTSTCPAPSPLGNSSSAATTSASQSVSSQCVQITKQLIDASLPSPGPLLGKTRLVDTYNISNDSKKSEDAIVSNLSMRSAQTGKQDVVVISTSTSDRSISPAPSSKRQKTAASATVNMLPASTSASDNSTSPKNQRLLQMCGGDIKIVARKEEAMPRFGSSGGSIISISPSSDSISEPSPLGIRTGLLSGGSIIETPKRVSSASSLSSPTPPAESLASGTPLPTSTSHLSGSKHLVGNYFQFPPPPINSITAYNPLTLPPPSQNQLSSAVQLPLNPIEATKILHGGKLIPFVPGIPGPNTLTITTPSISPTSITSIQCNQPSAIRSPSPSRKKIVPNSPVAVRAVPAQAINAAMISPSKTPTSSRMSPKITPVSLSKMTASISGNDVTMKSAFSGVANGARNYHGQMMGSPHQAIWSPALLPAKIQSSKKSFNFTRIADNLSPSKPNQMKQSDADVTVNPELQHFNFENLIPKPEIIVKSKRMRSDNASPLHIDVSPPAPTSIPTLILPSTASSAQSTSVEPNNEPLLKTATKTTKFLRPSSLPLKPGTFTPKRHHGITPTANTLPLISPETPRPSKNCIQLYLNGHAYTYLGLKCSTKTFYCTVNRPQPVHFTNQHKLSIYSNWQICAESNPHPLGLSPKEAMSLYDSRQRQQQYRRDGKYTVANSFTKFTTLHSQSLICTPYDAWTSKEDSTSSKERKLSGEKSETIKSEDNDSVDAAQKRSNEYDIDQSSLAASSTSTASTATTVVPGGYESNENYTYVRGRGRGRYVCSECGIRCKKPSMLKKHIRTHTDVRPYTCQHCSFR